MNPKIVEIVARAIYGELQKMAPTHLVAGIAWEDQREGLREYGRDQARAALTALSQAGYVVVPREPSEVMQDEGFDRLDCDTFISHADGSWNRTIASNVYKAMLAAYEKEAS